MDAPVALLSPQFNRWLSHIKLPRQKLSGRKYSRVLFVPHIVLKSNTASEEMVNTVYLITQLLHTSHTNQSGLKTKLEKSHPPHTTLLKSPAMHFCPPWYKIRTMVSVWLGGEEATIAPVERMAPRKTTPNPVPNDETASKNTWTVFYVTSTSFNTGE